MGFMQFIKSLDDLLYEIMAWLVFYPLTLWRVLRHPWTMMDYAAAQLEEPEGKQFADTLSPPLFLLLSLLLSHALELTYLGQSGLVASNRGLARYVTDDTSLLLLRLMIFSIFPMILATRLVRQQRHKLTRHALQAPFYSQCYLTGPFALVLGAGALLTQLHRPALQPVGLALMASALLWFGGLQIRWFSRKLDVSLLRGFWIATLGMIECLVVIAILAPLIV